MVFEVVHGTYDVEVLVVREEKDCDTQVGGLAMANESQVR